MFKWDSATKIDLIAGQQPACQFKLEFHNSRRENFGKALTSVSLAG